MKYHTTVLLILLLVNFYASAQTETIRVNAGDDIATAVSPYGIYRFPAFTNGIIQLKDGRQGEERLNFNVLSDQIMYIDKKGDTLAIGIPGQVKKITINETNFYYDKTACVEEIANSAIASLVVKRKISVDYQPKGEFGTSVPNTGGVDVYKQLPSRTDYHLVANEEAIIKKITSYFLITGEGQQIPATKSNFISLFAKNKDNIKRYLSSNKVDFNKERDLVQLLGIAASGD
ncbi:MAG: hypothetical protein ABJB86_05115 [Bacteroidota bacterium]